MKSAQGIVNIPASSPECSRVLDPEPSGVRSSELLDDPSEQSGIRIKQALPHAPRKAAPAARMLFHRGSPQCVLTVEAPAREDWMPELYRLLLSARVQVVRVHAQVMGETIRHELDVVEFDGTPLPEERWRSVQATAISYLGDRIMMLSARLIPLPSHADSYACEPLRKME